MALEEGLAGDAVGRADDRSRAVGDVGEHAVGRGLIITREVGLGQRRAAVACRPQDLVGARDGDARDHDLARLRGGLDRGGRLHLRGRLRGLGHLGGGLVLAKALEGGVAERSGLGVAAVFDLGDEERLDPVDVLRRLWRAGAREGALVRRGGLERGRQGLGDRLAVARADAAQVAQAALVADADQQGPEAGSALGRPAADDDLVPAPAFGFDPAGRAAGAIGRVQLLGDDALQIHAAGAFQHRLTGGAEMVDVAEAFRACLADPVDPGLKARLAVGQREFAQVLVALEQEVEGEIDQAVGAAVRDGGLQGREVGHVVGVERAQLPVDHGVRPAGGVGGQGGEAIAPVQTLAGAQGRLAAADADLDAVAVELDLMGPAGRAGRMVRDLAKLDRDKGGRAARLAGGGFRGFGLRRGLAGGGLRRRPLRLSLRDLGERSARLHRGVDLGEGVALARHGVIVLLLDQQPVVAFGRLAAIGLEPDQRPAALKALAVQRHLDRAPGEVVFQRVRMLRRP